MPLADAENRAKMAVVVSSCDRFFDAWRPFAAFWQRYWPASILPWPLYLIVNDWPVQSDCLQPISVGKDRGWSDNLSAALGRIDFEYLLYLQEDYFLTAAPDVATLNSLAALVRTSGVDLLCLRAMPPGYGAEAWPRVPAGAGELTEVPPDSPWRGRLQATIWRRDALLDALGPGESAWDFEARSAERLRSLRAWTVTANTPAANALPYLSSAIVRGLWTPEARALCSREQIPIQPDFRGTASSDPGACRRRRAWDRLRLPWISRWERLARGPMQL